jgi:probable rRNA maturation factor
LIKNLFVYSENRNLDKKRVHNLINSLKLELQFTIQSLYINFIDSEKIREINKEYLNHNYSTDVISFNYSGSNNELDGEIFISLDDAVGFAEKYKVSLNSELKRLVIHGILHLIGFDDNNKSNRSKMKKMENSLLNKNNFALLRSE